MNKVLIIFAACALSMTAAAQQTKLQGSWIQLDNDGRPTTQVKTFLPNGRLIGLSYNKDFTSHSVWFMSNYKVLNDTTYIDHAFYHSDINYQRDYYFTFHLENDSLMTTSYQNYLANGLEINMVERWKKLTDSMTCNDAEWEAMYQKSLVEFDRLPKEGKTVEQYAQELYAKAQDFKKTNRLDRASEALLMRAELDTTNLAWQKDLYFFYLEDKKLLKEYQQFLSDKLILAVFRSTDKERNLFGEYIVVERGAWTIEKPTATPDNTHFLMQKDDKYVDFIKKEDEKTNAEMVVMPVDATKKQDIIKQWKASKTK